MSMSVMAAVKYVPSPPLQRPETTPAGDTRHTTHTVSFTGIRWKDCTEYCRKCKGREHGKCHKVHKADCNGGYHCMCLGKHVSKSEVLKDAATCRLGL
ncbi:hypothetical protein COOONC_14504 [Cooperia oncophora]